MDIYVQYANVFKALGDPKRVMIVDMLSCGELCACKILEKFEISQSTLSHHMKFLWESGIVKSRSGWGIMVSSTSMRCWAPSSRELSSRLFFCRGFPAGRSLLRVSFWDCFGLSA